MALSFDQIIAMLSLIHLNQLPQYSENKVFKMHWLDPI